MTTPSAAPVQVHVEGMLDRDQRTVRTRTRNSPMHVVDSPASRIPSGHIDLGSPALGDLSGPAPRPSNGWRTRKNRAMWKIAQRLKRVLILSVYLLSVTYIPRSASAPTSMSNVEDRMNSHPNWINPCGMGTNEMAHDGETVMVSDRDLLVQIVLQAQIALSAADKFKEEYVEKTFNMDFAQNHNHWKTQRYDWLPNFEQIPKYLDENISDDHLKDLQLDKSLLDTYEYLQTIAVGLEQIVWDQEDEESPFYEKFKDTEFKLRAVLCEIQVAILERGLDMRPDVRRDVMTDVFRKNMSSRYLRDWLIFRDYMNALQYVIEVFKHLQQNL